MAPSNDAFGDLSLLHRDKLLADSLSISLVWCGVCAAVHWATSVVAPYVLPGFQRVFAKESQQRALFNRGVSMFHAVTMFSLTARYWLTQNRAVAILPGPVSRLEIVAVDIMLGYLYYDIVFELFNTRQMDSLGHHVLGVVSHLSTRLSGNPAASFYTMLVFIAEGSTPFLNVSWVLHQLQLSHTALFKFTVFLLLLTFFVFRILLGPLMVTHMLAHRRAWGPDNQGLMFWGNFTIVASFAVLNFYWFYKLVSIAAGKKVKDKRL